MTYKSCLEVVHKITVAHHIMGYQLCTLRKIYAGEEKLSNEQNLLVTACDSLQKTLK